MITDELENIIIKHTDSKCAEATSHHVCEAIVCATNLDKAKLALSLLEDIRFINSFGISRVKKVVQSLKTCIDFGYIDE